MHSLTQNLQWLRMTSVQPQPFSHRSLVSIPLCPHWPSSLPLAFMQDLPPVWKVCLSLLLDLCPNLFLTKLNLTQPIATSSSPLGMQCSLWLIMFVPTFGMLNIFQLTTTFIIRLLTQEEAILPFSSLTFSSLANFLAHKGIPIND